MWSSVGEKFSLFPRSIDLDDPLEAKSVEGFFAVVARRDAESVVEVVADNDVVESPVPALNGALAGTEGSVRTLSFTAPVASCGEALDDFAFSMGSTVGLPGKPHRRPKSV